MFFPSIILFSIQGFSIPNSITSGNHGLYAVTLYNPIKANWLVRNSSAGSKDAGSTPFEWLCLVWYLTNKGYCVIIKHEDLINITLKLFFEINQIFTKCSTVGEF